jgi:hypothetical protein
MKQAFYGSPVLRRFAGVDLGVAAAPDEWELAIDVRNLVRDQEAGGSNYLYNAITINDLQRQQHTCLTFL